MRRVLAVGAHPDDIELGCGGALLAHRAAGDEVTLLVLTSGQNGPGDPTVRRAEQNAAAQRLGAAVIWAGGIDCALAPDSRLITVVEAALRATSADVVYVHSPEDTHQDHRAAAAAVLSAARRGQRILHYQSPSSQGFTPTVFIDIADHLTGKLEALACHSSQVENSAMVEPDVITASARHYGALARLVFAEGFSPARFVWDVVPARTKTLAEAAAGMDGDDLAEAISLAVPAPR